MKKTLLDYISKKRKKPSNENESDSQANGHSTVQIQESVSRMSISISFFFSRQLTTFMMSEEAKHVCLVLHPIQVQKGEAYSERRFLRQTIKIGRFSLIWIDKLSNMSKMNRLQTMRQNLLFSKIKKLHVNPT